ncbi:hypothetical protein EBZ39_04035 [bacterium]|nr:hypothetical protein [bacterium]
MMALAVGWIQKEEVLEDLPICQLVLRVIQPFQLHVLKDAAGTTTIRGVFWAVMAMVQEIDVTKHGLRTVFVTLLKRCLAQNHVKTQKTCILNFAIPNALVDSMLEVAVCVNLTIIRS